MLFRRSRESPNRSFSPFVHQCSKQRKHVHVHTRHVHKAKVVWLEHTHRVLKTTFVVGIERRMTKAEYTHLAHISCSKRCVCVNCVQTWTQFQKLLNPSKYSTFDSPICKSSKLWMHFQLTSAKRAAGLSPYKSARKSYTVHPKREVKDKHVKTLQPHQSIDSHLFSQVKG